MTKEESRLIVVLILIYVIMYIIDKYTISKSEMIIKHDSFHILNKIKTQLSDNYEMDIHSCTAYETTFSDKLMSILYREMRNYLNEKNNEIILYNMRITPLVLNKINFDNYKISEKDIREFIVCKNMRRIYENRLCYEQDLIEYNSQNINIDDEINLERSVKFIDVKNDEFIIVNLIHPYKNDYSSFHIAGYYPYICEYPLKK